jgi:superfamily II RNA helicase
MFSFSLSCLLSSSAWLLLREERRVADLQRRREDAEHQQQELTDQIRKLSWALTREYFTEARKTLCESSGLSLLSLYLTPPYLQRDSFWVSITFSRHDH